MTPDSSKAICPFTERGITVCHYHNVFILYLKMLQEVLQIIFNNTFFFKWLIKILSFKTFSKQTFSCLSYTCIFLILSYEYFTCKNLIKIFMFSCCWYIWGEWTKRLSINKIPVLRLCQLDLNWIKHKWFKCILKISSPLVSQCKRKGYPVNSMF